jgi:uncharacterized protein
MFYLDSSILVCMFSNETRTREIQAWRAGLDGGSVWLSDWNLTEFSSAMSFKRRTAQISPKQRENAEALFQAYLRLYPGLLPVRSEHFRHAASIAGREDINVRAADALHLAIAMESNATICTLDIKMHQAAGILKIASLKP